MYLPLSRLYRCVNAHFEDAPPALMPPSKPEHDHPEQEPEDKPRVAGGHPPPPPPPPDDWDYAADAEDEAPGPSWRWTGSWDDTDSYTVGWGPPWGKEENPATLHPDGETIRYSITGSNNTGTTGFLSIISGTERGWVLASFSGAEVLTCTVKNLAGKTLPGTWSFVRQQFTPDERLPTVDNTWTLSITVAHGNAEDVNTHFIDEEPAPPEPSGWRYTGSWDASDSYTEGWGPEWGADPHPASLHPSVYSIHGSNNTGTHGTLSILSAKTRGWVLVSFSGAHVLDVHVKCGCPMPESLPLLSASAATRAPATWRLSDALVETASCPAMAGKWSEEEQEWTPDHRAPTVDATCTVDVTVAKGNLEDVNAHFIDKPGVKPQPDDRHAPPPPPDDWDYAADADGEEPGGGAAPPQTVCKGNWRWTGSWDGSDSYTRGWGPEWGDDENPPSHHPLYHSIHGSNNTGTVGHLSITSGVNRGWIKASFSGAEVLTCSVANYDGSKALAGS